MLERNFSYIKTFKEAIPSLPFSFICANDATDNLEISDACGNGSKNISFGYDGNNNITQQVDIANALNNYGYSYDEINRLLSEEGSLLAGVDTGLGSTNTYNKTFTYDAVGNRLNKAAATQNQTQTPSTTDEPYTYASNSNRLQSVNGATYQYDANGNAISKGNQSWAYNAQNRMASYSEGGQQQASYAYNGQGERVIKQRNGETIHYLYNATGQLQGEYHYMNGNLTLRQSYVWLGMLPIAMVKEDLAQQSQQIVYIHSDQLNTPRMVTDQNQQTVWQWHSSAFGEELPQENGLTFNLRFPGQYYDEESKTNYNYFRDYDPKTGRYLQSDPIGLAGGLNTYGYVGANPVGFIDPLGLSTCKIIAGAIGGSIGGIISGAAVGLVNGGIHGAIMGAITGGAMGALGGVLGGAVGGAVGSLPASAGEILANALGGGIADATSDTFGGGDVGYVVGGMSGGMFGAAAAGVMGGGVVAVYAGLVSTGVGVGASMAIGSMCEDDNECRN